MPIPRNNGHKKRTQAATDFLLSWGWVIAIVVVAIIIIFELGLFPSSKNATLINGFQGVTISNVGVNSSLFVVQLKNQFGQPVNINNVSVTINGQTYYAFQCSTQLVANGAITLCRVPVSISSSNYQSSVSIKYAPAGAPGTTLFSNGTISGSQSPGTISLNNLKYYFVESGLPNGYSWGVNLNQSTEATNTSTLVFSEPFGTYSFNVSNTSVAGCVTRLAPINGTVSSGVTEQIVYNYSCTTVFHERGLTNNDRWNVTYDGVEKSAAGSSSITFTTGVGTYAYSIPSYEVPVTYLVTTNPTVASPGAIAYDSVNRSLYVPSSSGNGISVFNASNGYITLSIKTSSSGAYYSPVDSYVYISNSSTNKVLYVSTLTNTLKGSISVGSSPGAIIGGAVIGTEYSALGGVPNGGQNIYIANYGSNTVTVLNSGSVVATITLGGSSPSALTFDPSNKEIYVAESGAVTVINDSSPKDIKNITISGTLDGIVYDPVNGEVYVLDSTTNSISVINATTNAVITTIPSCSTPNDIAMDTVNDNLYVACGVSSGSDVSVINGSANKNIQNFSFGTAFTKAAYDIGSGDLYFVSNTGNSILDFEPWAVNTPRGTLTAGQSTTVSFAPLSSSIFVTPPYKLYNNGPADFSLWWLKYGNVNLSQMIGSNIVIATAPAASMSYKGAMYPYQNVGTSQPELDFCNIIRSTAEASNFVTPSWNCSTFFQGYGLPHGYNWNILFNGTAYHSTKENITFYTALGNYTATALVLQNSSGSCTTTYTPQDLPPPYSINVAAGYHSPNNAGVFVDYTSGAVTTCTTPDANFTESGLPSGTSWWVDYNNTNRSSATNEINFRAISGNTYSFYVGAPAEWTDNYACLTKYTPSPSSGSLTAGPSGSITITFTSSSICDAEFTESGVNAGISNGESIALNWRVTYNGQNASACANGYDCNVAINFMLPSGINHNYYVRYPYCTSSGCIFITPNYTEYMPYPGSGSIATPSFLQIQYEPPVWTNFTESGLPSGASWSVTLNGNVTATTFGGSMNYNGLTLSNTSSSEIHFVTGSKFTYYFTTSSTYCLIFVARGVYHYYKYAASPSSGTISAGNSEAISFIPYQVSFC